MHRVRIYQGNIAKLAVDAAVQAVDERSAISAYQQPPLSLAVGQGFQADPSAAVHCAVGEVRVIAASSAMFFHTVCPVWRGGDQGEEQRLALCYQQVMQRVKQENLRSIAFPSIGVEIGGFPARRAIKIAVQEVTVALAQNPFLESVSLCCADSVTAALYRSHIGK